VTGRRVIRRKQLLDDLKEEKGCSVLRRKHYIALGEELALEDSMDLFQDRIQNYADIH
jgi:hypothetical protein